MGKERQIRGRIYRFRFNAVFISKIIRAGVQSVRFGKLCQPGTQGENSCLTFFIGSQVLLSKVIEFAMRDQRYLFFQQSAQLAGDLFKSGGIHTTVENTAAAFQSVSVDTAQRDEHHA